MISLIKKKKYKKNIIIWKKWIDPYGENIDEVEWPGYFDSKNKKNTDFYQDVDNNIDNGIDKDIEENEGDEDFNGIEHLNKISGPKHPVKLIMTTMGVMPLVEQCIPSKTFNFWVAHTNFDITQEIYHIVENTEGVEVLDVFTRYRLRVGIGTAFSDRNILNKINNNINKFLNS